MDEVRVKEAVANVQAVGVRPLTLEAKIVRSTFGRYFAYSGRASEDFCLHCIRDNCVVFGRRNRLIWSVEDGFAVDRKYSQLDFLRNYEEVQVKDAQWKTCGHCGAYPIDMCSIFHNRLGCTHCFGGRADRSEFERVFGEGVWGIINANTADIIASYRALDRPRRHRLITDLDEDYLRLSLIAPLIGGTSVGAFWAGMTDQQVFSFVDTVDGVSRTVAYDFTHNKYLVATPSWLRAERDWRHSDNSEEVKWKVIQRKLVK